MRYGYVENNVVAQGPCYLPTSWRNISGLDKMSPPALKATGWLPWTTEYLPGEIVVKSTLTIRADDILETVERRPMTQQEIDTARTEQQESARIQRQQAYVLEADPLFFMWQRGEATREEWEAKIAEIKARYPK